MSFVRVAGHASVLWTPVAHATIAAACHKAFGEHARLVACEAVTHGGFNTIYRVHMAAHEPVVLRVSPLRRAPLFRHERGLLAREAAVHTRLAAIGLVIPRILHQDFSCTTLPRPHLFLEYRRGQPWDDVAPRIAPARAASLWSEFGNHVRKIHAIEGEAFGSPLRGEGRASHAEWLLSLFDDLATDLAERKLLVPGLAEFRIALQRRREQLELHTPPRLVHGDLWLRNVLVTREPGGWRLGAILDAERAFWSEPAAEWIFSHLEIPPAFWEAYGVDLSPGRLDDDAVLRTLVYRARGALQLVLQCYRSGVSAAFALARFRACAQEFARH